MAETLALGLTGLAYGGDAFGRDAAGRMIFVPLALPGERVRVEVTESHRSWARARLLEVLEASPARVEPRCRHFGACGGCHYQHLSYAAQLQAKAEIVRAQFQRLGGFDQPPVSATVPSPSPWGIRNHLQFSLTPEGRLGFRAAGSHLVLPIEECLLPEPALADLWPRLDFGPVPGLERVTVRLGAEGDTMVVLEADGPPEVEVGTELDASIVWLGPAAASVLAGEPTLTIEVLGHRFRVSPGSFFQVNTVMAGELVTRLLEALAVGRDQTVLDLYAGVGLFSVFLAEAGARLVAVESSASACADFQVNLAAADDVSLYQAGVEEALPLLDMHPAAVVIDPPRAGLGRSVVEALVSLAPARLAYVSCDPATLARDARGLVDAGYRLESVTPLDFFPQTFHIETLSFFRKET